MDNTAADLIVRFLDPGAPPLSEAERAALNDTLRRDPAARDLLADLSLHTRTLRESLNPQSKPSKDSSALTAAPHADAEPAPGEASGTSPGTSPYPIYRKGYEPQPSRFRPVHYAVAAVAATLLAACGLATYLLTTSVDPEPTDPTNQPGPPIATLIESTGTLLVDSDIANEGSEYPAGDYVLDAGAAQFLLRNRVTVNLRGKTDLRVHNPQNVTLARGRADFKVPRDATGFTVHLPDRSMVIDLGTAFRVQVDDDGRSKIRVTTGTVAWTPPGEPEMSVLLGTGQIAHLVDGRVEVTEAPSLLAYHDLGGEPSPGHITTQRALGEIVKLVDHYDGSETGIELTISGASAIDVRAEGETRPPAFGTPADELFTESGIDLDDGFVVVGGNQPSKRMTLTLAGLDPNQRYDLALYGDRDAKPDGPERFTLDGAAFATNASSASVIDAFNNDLETRPNATRGHVVRWTDIAPGADGEIEVHVQITDVNLAYLSALRLAAEAANEASKETVENQSSETTLIEGDPQ